MPLIPPLVVVLLLPTLFVAFLGGATWWLSWQIHLAIEDLALGNGAPAWAGTRLALLSLGVVNVLLLFKPLLAGAPRRPASRVLKAAGQPELFDLVKELSEFCQGRMPVEIVADTSMAVRMDVRGGVGGWLKQRLVLTIGVPLVAALSQRELAGAIAAQMGRNPRGLHGLMLQVFRGMNAWLDWAVCRRDPWEESLAEAAKDAPAHNQAWMKMLHGFVWLTQRPVWIFMMVARIASAGPLRNMVLEADRCEAMMTGSEAMAKSMETRGRFDRAWRELGVKIQEGIKLERLPDNLPLLAARFAKANSADRSGSDKLGAGDLFCPSDKVRAERVRKLGLPALMAEEAESSALFRDFNDLARQMTQFYYQNDLGLNIVQFRIVAAEESVQQGRKAEDSMPGVKRYFRGLAHPDRVLCGLVAEGGSPASRQAFIAEIQQCRNWMGEKGDQMRALLKEWTLGWQRCRDLEMGHAFALAGMALDNHQYGVRAHSAPLYRAEADHQSLAMTYSDESLVTYEARLESLLTASLGLLCHTAAEQLPADLRQLRDHLPAQAAVYSLLAPRMAGLRELMTLFNAFQALGVRHAGSVENPALCEALRFLTPLVAKLAYDTLAPLRGAPCPTGPGTLIPCLGSHLIGHPADEALRMLSVDWRQIGLRPDFGIPAAVQLGALVEKFLDSSLNAYHGSFEWLAAAAERSEDQLAGQAASQVPAGTMGSQMGLAA